MQTDASEGKHSRRPLLLGCLAVAVLAMGLYLGASGRRSHDEGTKSEVSQEALNTLASSDTTGSSDWRPVEVEQNPASSPAAKAESASVDDRSTPTAPGPSEEAPAIIVPESAAVAPRLAPSVDVVRVAPDGQSLVAGRAAPGDTVTIVADQTQLAEVEADAQGEFVAIFRASPSIKARELTLEAKDDEGAVINSEDVVVLVPEAVADSGEDAVQTRDAEASVLEVEDDAEADDAEIAGPAPRARVAAAAVVRDGDVELQPVARPRDAGSDDVSIASISYARAGEVSLAGFGVAGSELRAYVDDEFTQEGFIDASGRWNIELADVDAGLYRLRIDQIAEDGTVASRIETPFQRDIPRARPASSMDADAVSVIVQPGNNLWTLARIHYGAGVLYTQIFSANRELIRDPDLIYPGQIFDLPEGETN